MLNQVPRGWQPQDLGELRQKPKEHDVVGCVRCRPPIMRSGCSVNETRASERDSSASRVSAAMVSSDCLGVLTII